MIKSLEITGKIEKEGPDTPYTEDIDLSIRIREDITNRIGRDDTWVEFGRGDIWDEVLLVKVDDLKMILGLSEKETENTPTKEK